MASYLDILRNILAKFTSKDEILLKQWSNVDKSQWKITEAEVLMGRDKEYPLDTTLKANLMRLMVAINLFREAYGKPMQVTSGYRPGRFNVAAGGAPRSSHLTCEACDFADPDGSLAEFCRNNIELLETCKLYLEDPTYTTKPNGGSWVHLQVRWVANRIFKP